MCVVQAVPSYQELLRPTLLLASVIPHRNLNVQGLFDVYAPNI